MAVAQRIGRDGNVVAYEIGDDQLPVGCTFGGPKIAVVVKANGAIEKVFDMDAGGVVLGTLILRYFDGRHGALLEPDSSGRFLIHPAHQEHRFSLPNGLDVRERIFVLNSCSEPGRPIDPPAAYYMVELRNHDDRDSDLTVFAFSVLRGDTFHDVRAEFDADVNGFVVWNQSNRKQTRVVGCSEPLAQYQTTLDFAMALSESVPPDLSGLTDQAPEDPLGVMRLDLRIAAHETRCFSFKIALGNGAARARKNYAAAPDAEEGLNRTIRHFDDVLSRSAIYTPDPHVNAGVYWAKANMLRVQANSPTGWGFTNDPTRSCNAVGRDTAWFSYGADYVSPGFARESLLGFVQRQKRDGLIVEYYNLLTGEIHDDGLNINDNTPLLVIALWHHYNLTGDIEFLKSIYDAAVKAGRYILSQRNELGLVNCTATGTDVRGIVGWRNVIPNYTLSGATTEVNSECYSALATIAEMARVLGRHDDSTFFNDQSNQLREAINEQLANPANGLYYLNIDVHGRPHSDVTSDLVFPVIFGAAEPDVAARIVARLSGRDFWTHAGMRTTPRDAPTYTPNGGWGLMGGIWVGVSFWYAFAAAPYSPSFMARALSTSFRNYSSDPLRSNTVPGQFSEWLDGETFSNNGMMLSPWFPPRYVWAAVEGIAGLNVTAGQPVVTPRLAPAWKWLAVRNVPFRGQSLSWLVVKAPEEQLFCNFHNSHQSLPNTTWEEDISPQLDISSTSASRVAFRNHQRLLLFAGNTEDRSIVTHIHLKPGVAQGAYRVRQFNSLLGRWQDYATDLVPADELEKGMTVQIEREGFWLFDLRQEV